MLRSSTLHGRPSAIINGGMSCTTLEYPPTIAKPPDTHELMYADKAAEIDALLDLDMAGNAGHIRHGDPAADPAVVADVTIGHNQVVVADPRLVSRALPPGGS